MMINAKSMNKQVLFNLLTLGVQSGVGFLAVPIFSRMLGPVQYGKYSVFYSWVLLFSCLMGMQTHSCISTGYYDFKEDYLGFRSGILLIGSSFCIFWSCAYVFVSAQFPDWLGYSFDILIILLVSSYFHYVVDFSRIAFIYEKKAIINFIIQSSLSISTVLLSLFLFNSFSADESYLSRVYGTTIPYCIVGIGIILFIFIQRPFMPKSSYWRYSLFIGVPIVFHSLASRVLGQADCIMLEKLGNAPESVGIYSFCCTYTNVLTSVLNALNVSWVPFLFDDLSEKRLDRLREKSKNYIELFSFICIVFILLSREMIDILGGDSYRLGANLIPLFVVSIYLIFMYQFSINYEMFVKKTTIIALGTMMAAILNIILNAVLIVPYGMYGAAIATCGAWLALFLIHYHISKELQNGTPYVKIGDFLVYLILLVLMCVIYYSFEGFSYLRWLLGVIIGSFLLHKILKRRSIF